MATPTRPPALARPPIDPVMAALVGRHGPMRLRRQGARRPALRGPGRVHRLPAAGRQGGGHDLGSGAGALRPDGSARPDAVLTTPEADLRGAGLSAGQDGRHPRPGRATWPTGELALDARRAGCPTTRSIDQLIAVRGIGPWTAQMFLIFDLQRLDVWPTGDSASGPATASPTAWPSRRRPRSSRSWGSAFRPYRSVAAWYCWRSVDTPGQSPTQSADDVRPGLAAGRCASRSSTPTARSTGSCRAARRSGRGRRRFVDPVERRRLEEADHGPGRDAGARRAAPVVGELFEAGAARRDAPSGAPWPRRCRSAATQLGFSPANRR